MTYVVTEKLHHMTQMDFERLPSSPVRLPAEKQNTWESRTMRPLQRLVNQPEFSFFIFGVLLNFPWEFLQVPFFKGLPDAPHWDAVRLCAWATLGDGIIILIGYWTTAAAWRDRWWFMRPAVLKLAAFIAVGLIITIVLEQLATSSSHPVWRWRYSEMMPLIPGIGIGLTPFLQWILIPPLVVWFSRRQLG